MLLKKNKTKIFCIGLNKTGTTTLESVLKEFGYTLGNQVTAELLLEAWFARDFNQIIAFSKNKYEQLLGLFISMSLDLSDVRGDLKGDESCSICHHGSWSKSRSRIYLDSFHLPRLLIK